MTPTNIHSPLPASPAVSGPARPAPAIYYTIMDSPLGRLVLTGTPQGLRSVWIAGEKHDPGIHSSWKLSPETFHDARQQLKEYFAGTRRSFQLACNPHGTPFQQKAWATLQQIPFGHTLTYQQQAAIAGHPAAIRAIGSANGKNPLSIIVPCHRVIGANGRLTGYGGGLAAKQWLLDHERRHL